MESKRELPLIEVRDGGEFNFKPGCTHKQDFTTSEHSSDPVNVTLRHKELQEKLYRLLCNEYGEEHVGTEHPSGNGMRIDAVVKTGEEYFFYEIKTYANARACIREAVGQLLEYSHWPGGQKQRSCPSPESQSYVLKGSDTLNYSKIASTCRWNTCDCNDLSLVHRSGCRVANQVRSR